MNLPQRVIENNERLERIAATNEHLVGVADQLRAGWEVLAPLIEYYETFWQEDLRTLGDAHIGLFSEDGVWNEMGQFYQTAKEIAEVAADIVKQYEGE